jgi:hypothetical protein
VSRRNKLLEEGSLPELRKAAHASEVANAKRSLASSFGSRKRTKGEREDELVKQYVDMKEAQARKAAMTSRLVALAKKTGRKVTVNERDRVQDLGKRGVRPLDLS